MKYYTAITKNKILPFVTRVNPDCIVLSEISQAEKYKYCMISFIYGIKNNNTQNKGTK